LTAKYFHLKNRYLFIYIFPSVGHLLTIQSKSEATNMRKVGVPVNKEYTSAQVSGELSTRSTTSLGAESCNIPETSVPPNTPNESLRKPRSIVLTSKDGSKEDIHFDYEDDPSRPLVNNQEYMKARFSPLPFCAPKIRCWIQTPGFCFELNDSFLEWTGDREATQFAIDPLGVLTVIGKRPGCLLYDLVQSLVAIPSYISSQFPSRRYSRITRCTTVPRPGGQLNRDPNIHSVVALVLTTWRPSLYNDVC